MKLFKPLRTGYLGRIVIHAGQPRLAVALLHYFPFDDPRRIGLEQELWTDVMPVLGDRILDPCDPKPRAEVIVYGAFHAPAGETVRHGTVRLRLGSAIDKTLQVTGDREWVRSRHGRLRATAPLPFQAMPLEWERAFGGADYPENPSGIGGWPGRNGAARYPLPNLEYPERRIRLPDDRPPPAAFAPRPVDHPERLNLVGTHDAYWAQHHEPGYARDIQPDFFLTAARDQVLPGYFHGGEMFRIENMHPRNRQQKGQLPGLRARCFVHQKRPDRPLGTTEGGRFIEVPVQPDTLLLFPDLERAILIHHGSVALQEIDGLDLNYLVAGFEWLEDKPRPATYWQAAMEKRLDPARVARAVVETADLCPIGWVEPTLEPATTIKPFAPRDDAALPPRMTGLIARVKGEAAQARKAAGLPAATPLSEAAGSDEPPEVKAVLDAIDQVKDMRPASFAEAEEFRAKMQVVSDRIESLGRGKWADTEAEARRLADRFGYDYEVLTAQSRAEAGGEPNAMASRLAALAERSKEGLAPDVKARLEAGMPKDLESRLAGMMQETATAQARCEKEAAHLFPKPELLPGSRQLSKARALAQALAAGEAPSDKALAGLDLTGRRLDGMDLSGVDLTGAQLVGASLMGTNLADAGLAHADLTRANLNGANLKGANLNRAVLHDTSLVMADLSGVQLADIQAQGLTFSQAKLVGTRFSGCRMSKVSFVRADLSEASFNQCSFEHVDLRSATVAMTAFIFCRLDNADFRRISGARLMLINCQAAGAKFYGAKVDRLSVAGKTVLDRADFCGTSLPACNLSFASLVRAHITDAQMPGANFWQSDLTGANLSGSFLRGGLLMHSNLTDAVLEGTDLMDGNLLRAVLVRTNLRAANLYGANTLKAVLKDTVLDRAEITGTRLLGPGMP